MSVFAIVSEYNPFHNGHKYQIQQAKALGASHIIAIMSGNFVQRGDVAIMDKHTRANCALMNGIDLVIELPTPYAVSCAQTFAKRSVYIADSLNCVDKLCFGSESGNIDELILASNIANSEEVEAEIKNQLSLGVSYPKALSMSIKKNYSDINPLIFSSPNNILALEYINALKEYNSSIAPITVKRSVKHDSKEIEDDIASASFIREMMYNRDKEYLNYIPSNTRKIIDEAFIRNTAPAQLQNLERAILYKLRISDKEQLSKIPDISEGLENRILEYVKTVTSLNSLLDSVKTKRYTYVRIKRIILSAFLELTQDIQQTKPTYVKVLGFNDKGLELLSIIKSKSKLPIIVRCNDVKHLSDTAKYLYNFESKATDIYSLATPNILSGGLEYTTSPAKGVREDYENGT